MENFSNKTLELIVLLEDVRLDDIIDAIEHEISDSRIHDLIFILRRNLARRNESLSQIKLTPKQQIIYNVILSASIKDIAIACGEVLSGRELQILTGEIAINWQMKKHENRDHEKDERPPLVQQNIRVTKIEEG